MRHKDFFVQKCQWLFSFQKQTYNRNSRLHKIFVRLSKINNISLTWIRLRKCVSIKKISVK